MAVELHYWGHAFFKLRLGKKNILIDPFSQITWGSAKTAPTYLSPVKEKDVQNTDLILISNEHPDHFDPAFVEKIALRDRAMVVAHDHVLNQLKIPRAYWQPIGMGKKVTVRGISVEGMPAHSPQSFYPLGYMLEHEGVRVYHAGDTELLDDLTGFKANVCLLPIGGGSTMDCVDAVRLVKTLKPDLAIPMHYNTFEQIRQDPQEFKQKIEKSLVKTKAVILKPGQKCKY